MLNFNATYMQEDSCFTPDFDQNIALKQYSLMRDALNKTGRHIFFSLCGWKKWYAAFGTHVGNSWRITPDVCDWQGVYRSAHVNENLGKYAVSH
jgi:alpha-galactosidase